MIAYKIKLTWLVAIACGAASLSPVMGDSPSEPVPKVTVSARGDFLFKMVPSRWRKSGDTLVVDREPFGVAYKITREGEFQEIWRTEGWYTFESHLSEDGRYLVRFGPWASDQKEHSDLAIAFYDNGKLVKRYEVRELIQEPDKLMDSVSHYTWSPSIQTKPNGFYENLFHLVMIDKTTYDFDYKTGEIKLRNQDKGAKSYLEIRAEEKAAASKRGRELLESSSFKKDYEQHFDISRIEEAPFADSSCSLDGPVWNSELIPKRKFDQDVSVFTSFPIRDGGRVEVSLTPQEVISAVEKALKHPFVKKQFEAGASGIRVRIQGDRLHWDTPELVEFIKKTKWDGSEDDRFSHWAYLIIGTGAQCTSNYFNTKTGEMIAVDESNWPWTPYLIDSTGNRQNPSKAAPTEGDRPSE